MATTLQKFKVLARKDFPGIVKSMELKFPNAEIVRRTGESKGNVSIYINGGRTPSDQFLEKFYNSFKNEIEKLDTNEGYEEKTELTGTILTEIAALKAAIKILTLELINVKSIQIEESPVKVSLELERMMKQETEQFLDELRRKYIPFS